jgi:nitroreductase
MPISKYLRSHRSIRSYKPDDVPESLLNELLQDGIRASSSGNMQSYSVIVTRDKTLREKLYKAHYEQGMILEAPVLITFCADFHRMRRWLRVSNAPDNFDNFMSFMVAAIDAVLVAQNIAIAAEAQGLGICYMGTTLASCKKIGSLLNLPDNVFPVTSFVLGYPNEDPELRDRLPQDALVHYETYQDYTDERIKELYHDRETAGWDRYMSIPKLRALIEESGVENLGQLYTTVKYTRESHEKMSRLLMDYLNEQDFMNGLHDGQGKQAES